MDIVEFLSARLKADQQEAQYLHVSSCGAVSEYDWPCDCGYPARVLADIAAKRRILTRHSRPIDSWVSRFHPNSCAGCGQQGEFDDPRTRDVNECPEVRDLAAPYAAHPDFDPAWAVGA